MSSKNKEINLFKEAVTKLVTESMDDSGINWDNLEYLNRKGQLSRLNNKWQVIMLARNLSGNDFERSLAILKAAVATLEAKKMKMSSKPEEIASEEDMLDMASLVSGK